MFLRNRQKGQSTVEYIVLVTAVIVIIIAFLIGPTSPFANRMNASMDAVTQQANQQAQALVTAQATFITNRVGTNIIGNRADNPICPPGQTFHPEAAVGLECQ